MYNVIQQSCYNDILNTDIIAGPLPIGPYDFSLPALPNEPNAAIELVFNATDTRQYVAIDIVDDLILEATDEELALILSVPANPPIGQENGAISQAFVTIVDNEGASTEQSI